MATGWEADDTSELVAAGDTVELPSCCSCCCWSSEPVDGSRSKVRRSESPGCKMTLACRDELISEQADGLAQRGAF